MTHLMKLTAAGLALPLLLASCQNQRPPAAQLGDTISGTVSSEQNGKISPLTAPTTVIGIEVTGKEVARTATDAQGNFTLKLPAQLEDKANLVDVLRELEAGAKASNCVINKPLSVPATLSSINDLMLGEQSDGSQPRELLNTVTQTPRQAGTFYTINHLVFARGEGHVTGSAVCADRRKSYDVDFTVKPGWNVLQATNKLDSQLSAEGDLVVRSGTLTKTWVSFHK
ncbi:hypothetical protein [Deinococcus sp. Marseille-Q6407]|uniref:hypothetical protein n=1 Tax=Deinococcus sp. Marseille-Q6407 TaxID=2969223 RepID=UPI0021C1F190|nr:hypothetical protein [Deinococcus sp. Marseille-Q6407]